MSTTPKLAGVLAAGLFAAAANAAFIVEPNGLASANFSAGSATTNSTTAGSGTLLAPGLTFGVASVYGGEPYTYTYTPAANADNVTTWTTGTVLNSGAGINSSGLAGGGAGIYNIYHVFPQTTNASGQPTLYQIFVNGGTTGVTMVMSSQDQNINDTNAATSGVGVGLWELVGQATVLDPNQPITLNIATTTSEFVGARTAGVLFEYAGPVPEPSSFALAGFGLLGLLARRRR